MSLSLQTSQQINETVDEFNIDSFAADIENQQIVIGYQELASGTIVRERTLTLSGLDFLGAISAANTNANAQPAGQVDVYAAIKQALYSYITTLTGINGTVS